MVISGGGDVRSYSRRWHHFANVTKNVSVHESLRSESGPDGAKGRAPVGRVRPAYRIVPTAGERHIATPVVIKGPKGRATAFDAATGKKVSR